MSSHLTATGRSFFAGLLDALTGVMGASSGYLKSHGPRVAMLARQIARGIGVSGEGVARITLAGVLADIGMIGLAEEAWEEESLNLAAETRERVRLHPVRSALALEGIPHLDGLGDLVRHHHEWFDGSGYPDGLMGAAIPRGARILRLADTVVALSSDRPARAALDPARIEAIVLEFRGVEFDPEVVDAWVDLLGRGGIAPFEPHAFERHVQRATEQLVPPDVSPLSSDQLLEILASIIDAKDPYTAGHSRRVAIFAVAVADQLGLTPEMKSTLWAAGYLHDLGKLAIPVRVLVCPDRLTEEEERIVRTHTTMGAEILSSIPSLRHLRAGARHHHERWDGTGYPAGLKGDRIPLVPRILAIADAYDAMTTRRAYRAGRSHLEAMDEISHQAGRHFCPDVAAAFLSLPAPFFEAITSPAEWRPEPLTDPARRAARAAWRYL
ncbi:MAG: HD domain-containing phosphohydrolase [Longimicrobiales bacterium]|nr:HD domain-containing phosphohydrolase [Longimicrobiales bacterium]